MPENSIQAILNCIDMRIDMVEIDIQKTRDGQYILMHDGSIDRTTNGTGNVWELDWTYLENLNLKDEYGRLTTHKIPTLTTVLDSTKGKIMLNLDKAYWLIDELYPMLEARGQTKEMLFKGRMKTYQQVDEELETPLDQIIFMPIIKLEEEGWRQVVESYKDHPPVAFEVLFETDELVNEAFDLITSVGSKVWVNTMWDMMSAGRNDDAAIGNEDNTYGWLYEKGVRMFQTDRIRLMSEYFERGSLRQQHVTENEPFYLGADLSYVNEMNDCGATYKDGNQEKDVYEIFSDYGTNLARYRLWHDPDSVDGYSFFNDVKRAIARAKAAEMEVLLDFHYSDIWADPGRQWRPKAWDAITDDQVLADSVYQYTYNTLSTLRLENLLPEMVQIGNETNGNILQKITEEDLRESSPNNHPIDWNRQTLLLGRGIEAVDDFNNTHGTDVKTMLHIAQPENIEWWMDKAYEYGLNTFDIIGFSYYPRWSEMALREMAQSVDHVKNKYRKEVMMVEVSYPWKGKNEYTETHDDPHNPQDQYNYMTELTFLLKSYGGSGVIYWEPAWVDTECETLWGTGSSHDYELLFDKENTVLPGMDFYNYDYSVMPEGLREQQVSFKVNMTGIDTEHGVFVTGDFTGDSWNFVQMNKSNEDEIYEATVNVMGRSTGAFAFYKDDDWDSGNMENVPSECALFWDTHRKYLVQNKEVSYELAWSSCDSEPLFDPILGLELTVEKKVYPNPATTWVNLNLDAPRNLVKVYNRVGELLNEQQLSQSDLLDVSTLGSGIYLVRVNEQPKLIKLIVQ